MAEGGKMILSFILSMPSRGSWNGGWSGGRNLYAKVINFGKTQKGQRQAEAILKKRRYSYSFGDGWAAAIDVREVDATEAARLRRKSKGFCGYDWMVDSIRFNGTIEAPTR
jgi:hypothetical protein